MVSAVCWFLIPIWVLLIGVLVATGGHFTYTLDDPYIHLALAKNIWAGTYGINISEPSAPSSSIIWPFLLAPFSVMGRGFEYVPLIFNAVFMAWTGLLLVSMFQGLGPRNALLFSLGVALVFNLYGLVFTGLEHSLQILCVVMIARGLMEGESKAAPGLIFWLALFLLPLVRYEGLAVTLPVLGYMYMQGQRRKSAMVALSTLTVMALFSAYLHAKGLGVLPSSVLAKSSGFGLGAALKNLKSNIEGHGWMALLMLGCGIYFWRNDRPRMLMALSICALHFSFGRHGSYGRYEVYFVLLLMLLAFDAVRKHAESSWKLVCALPVAFSGLAYATVMTPLAASNIYHQQVQMASMARELGSGVAVNDLGLVSLRGGVFVLDLWGLGSIDALRQRAAASPDDAEWMSTLMQRKGVAYAMIYDQWFDRVPHNWIKVAEMQLKVPRVTVGSMVVSFYATNEDAAARMSEVVSRYRDSHATSAYAISMRDELAAPRYSQISN